MSVPQKRWETVPARELALLWAPAEAHGQQGCALAPSSLSLVPMTSSSQPEPTAGASSLRILFWDSDVYSFLRISQVAQTEWLPVSPKSPGIWLQTKFAWGQYSASPQPRWQAEGKDSEVPWLREQLQTCILVSDFLKASGTDSPLFKWTGGEESTGLP